MIKFVRRNWFVFALLLIFGATLGDTSLTTASLGRWVKAHYGMTVGVCLIFFLSGLLLDVAQVREGILDFKGILIALGVIFVAAPVLAAASIPLPLTGGVLLGLFLVAVMPTTLSSGVVMTGAAGGNTAHALVITIVANALSVFTIPYTLSFLLGFIGSTADIRLDKGVMMLKIGVLVLLPLVAGMLVRTRAGAGILKLASKANLINQSLILAMVWMAISQTRAMILDGYRACGVILLVSVGFHAMLLAAAAASARLLQVGRGRRESILFMGAQKTLPLSIMLQATLFPQYGLAAVVCVVHHVAQLVIDGYLVGRLREADD